MLDVKISEHEDRWGCCSAAALDVRLSGRWALRLTGDYELSPRAGQPERLPARRGAAYRF